MSTQPILISGAGLAGSLLAGLLARRGFQVEVFETRPDLRRTEISAGRSINLALSHRGLRALERAGLRERMLTQALPMLGRRVHPLNGEEFTAPYGRDSSLYINSISRGGLNAELLDWAESFENTRLHFRSRCVEVDLANKTLKVQNLDTGEIRQVQGQLILGTDGADSAVRKAMESQVPGFKGEVTWESHGYKELSIRPDAAGQWLIAKDALHIWPRGGYMLIALPNLDGSFTLTLFLALEGESLSFEALNSPEKVRAFFAQEFPDAAALMPHLEEEFFQNPVGKLGTLRCFPWVQADQVALLGDAAHAVVPFYGQGMNASFEDCLVLDECIEEFGTADWTKVLAAYQERRKINGDAIGDLAVENFFEMRDHVANPVFQRKRRLENLLEHKFPQYRSKYALVTFHPEVGYSYAKARGNAQDAWLMNYCQTNPQAPEGCDLEAVYAALVGDLGGE